MLKHFQTLSEKIQETSEQKLLPWEARWISHLLVKSLILENPKLDELIENMSSEKNFPQAKLRSLRSEIKKSRMPSVAKLVKSFAR